jgi:hypothetical protein
VAATDGKIASVSSQARLQGSLSRRAEVVRQVLLAVVWLVQMVKAIRLLAVRAASPSRPEASVSLPVVCGRVGLLGQAKPARLLRPEPLDPRQLLMAGFPLHEQQRQSAVERSWDSQS